MSSGFGPSVRGVVQVVQSLDRGGLEMMATDLAISLRKRGIESAIVALDEGGRLSARLRDAEVGLHVLGGAHFASPRTHVALTSLLRRLRPATVHTHHLPPLLVSAAAARVAGARLVHTEHAHEYLHDAPKLRGAVRLASRAVSTFCVVGTPQAAYYRDVVGVAAHKLRVVTNGIDVERFRPTPPSAARRVALGLPPGLLVGAVGRLSPEKNFEMLLRGVSLARRQGAEVSAALVGDGQCGAALEALAASLGIAEHVRFLGWRTDVPDLLGTFDVLALTSWSEGLPLVVLEAMAAGIPVVCTAVGDLSRVLDDGRAGVIVPVDDAAALAEQLAVLARDPARRATLAAAGRARVVEHYSQRAMVDAYLNAYGAAEQPQAA